MPTLEERVRAEIDRVGPAAAFPNLIAENDALIRGSQLDNGRALTAARSAIYTEIFAHWAAGEHRRWGYAKPFALVALGGTGRGEVTPCSDADFAFLFDDVIEGNPFLLHLQNELLHTDGFQKSCGFTCPVLPFNLDDALRLSDKQLNAFVDMRAVYDPDGLTEVFRDRIRTSFDPFEHFLHVRGFWKSQWEQAAREWERLDRFDIKNDGLRVFLAGIWTLAGRGFVHSHEIYPRLEDPRDLAAYAFLLRIRCFVHLRQTPKRQSAREDRTENVLEFDDFNSFGELLGAEADEQARFEFANLVRARLLSARRRVAVFTKGIIEQELKQGREISRGNPIVYGVCGLYHRAPDTWQTARERSRAALSLVLASQRYGVPIDPAEMGTTFQGLGDWVTRVPELSALFYEPKGSLADSFAFLAQFDGAEDRLFPGYAKFEASFDTRVMAERKSLRGALERQKIRILEHYVQEGRAMLARAVSHENVPHVLDRVSVEVEAALLDSDHLAAIKLALKTKRLPLTRDDLEMRRDTQRPLHVRFSTGISDIPLERYYEPYRTECDFSAETVRTAEFLVANRREFKERADADINDERQVEEFGLLCQSETLLRTLFVFTCADRAEWESEREEPTRWFNMRELYAKAMLRFRPGLDLRRSVESAGYSPEQLEVLRNFGPAFYDGVYRRYANRFGSHLLQLAEDAAFGEAKVSILRDGMSIILGVSARDYRGLAACISGALWHGGVGLRQAHFFSAAHYGLALDFFHVAPGERPVGAELTRAVVEAIGRRRYISDEDEADLPPIHGTALLNEWRPGQYCLRFESAQDENGVVYALCYRVFRYLEGNIFGLAGHAARGHAYVSVYLSLPRHLPFEAARTIVEDHF